jgi:hypothetical protein
VAEDEIISVLVDVCFAVSSTGKILSVPTLRAHALFADDQGYPPWTLSTGPCATRIWDVLYAPGSAEAASFAEGFSRFSDTNFSLQVAIDGLPRHLERQGRHYVLTYHRLPFSHEGAESPVLVCLQSCD